MGHQTLAIKHSVDEYRYSSFGFGNKKTKNEKDKNIPGVGSYKLPSIFDKF
jgi:hypothetical protein